MAQNLDQVIADVTLLLNEISQATNTFEREAGYSCRSGCGQCCLKPTVEAQVVEMLPMAQRLIDLGIADQIYDQASEQEDAACILYQGTPGNPEMGRCGHYEARPSLCRLFGFSAVGKKSGPPELATCQWHKKLYPEQVRTAQEKINAGASVPRFSDFTMQIHNLSPSSSWGHRHPINRALKIALEKLLLARQYSE
jgi:Fe-S-cluster containining protein